MRTARLALVLAVVSLQPACAGSVELDPQYQPSLFRDRVTTIDPDKSVYGVTFGSTEAEVMAEFGEPNGVFVINDVKRAMLYGRSHLFIFRKDKLRELTVSDYALTWTVANQMEDHPFFDRGKWVIAPGFRKEMNFAEVRNLLQKPDAEPDHRYSFEGERSLITLQFSSWQGKSGPESYRIHGFTVVHYGD